MASAASMNQDHVARPLGHFPPSLWGDVFTSFAWDNEATEMHAKEVQLLTEEVRSMLLNTSNSMEEKINLIDNLERLGLSYKFNAEIEKHLEQIFNCLFIHESRDELTSENINDDYRLCTVALLFRILRQHGYDISTGIFEKFMDNDINHIRKFKKEHCNDAEGLLSLYEAAYLRRHGEDILEEALAFAKGNLTSMVNDDDHTFLSNTSSLGKQVKHALEQPLHRGCPRLEARHYISIYEEKETKNQKLLRLAKLDYNLLQMMHQQELCEISRWWKKWDFVGTLKYPRDRVVECYFWALGLYYEPQYSRARVMATKAVAMTSIMDDTYDAYGTPEELEIFTRAVERWNIEEIDSLPSYMKLCYMSLLDLFEDFDKELKEKGRSFAVDYSKERMRQLVISYNKESRMFVEGYMPQFDEYIENGLTTSTYLVVMPSLLLGMDCATKETFEWVMTNPKIVVASAKIGRYTDDIATYELERERGQVVCGIGCYMKQYGVSKEETFEKFREFVDDAWKDVNEDYVRDSSIPMDILIRALNQARVIDVVYKNDQDGYTHPEKVLKPHIISLLLDPITL